MDKIFDYIDNKQINKIPKELSKKELSSKKCNMNPFFYAMYKLYQGNEIDLKILIKLANNKYTEVNHHFFYEIYNKTLFTILLHNYELKDKIDQDGNPLWYYLIKSRFFIQEKIYSTIDVDYDQPDYNGNYPHFIAFYEYKLNNINTEQITDFYNYLIKIKYKFGYNDKDQSFLEEFYESSNIDIITIEQVKPLLLLKSNCPVSSDNELINKFLQNFNTTLPRMKTILEEYPVYDNKKVIDILHGSFTMERYLNLTEKDKIELLGIFYQSFVNLNETQVLYVIHPLIHSFDIYVSLCKVIDKKLNKNYNRIVLGESLNKMMFLYDNFTKTTSNYLAFSNHFYERDSGEFNKKKYDRYIDNNLNNYKKLIENSIKNFDKLIKNEKIYLIDFAYTGMGMISFLHLFKELYPKEFKSIICVLTYSEKDSNYIRLKKMLNKMKVKYIFIKVPYFILKVFYDELYNDRCMKRIQISRFKLLDENELSDQEYRIPCQLNRCNLLKFYILNQLEHN
jgi:hypothetical protein